MATNMNRIWKILLYITGAIVVLFVLTAVWWWFTVGSEQNAFLRALEQKNRQTSATLTEVSYLFNKDGEIVTEPASSLVDLKINGSDQPLRTKAPFSFTLTWKIDPSVELDSCYLAGPNYREGAPDNIWLRSGRRNEVKTYEGSFRFENVMPGSAADNYATAPLYHGFASFSYTEPYEFEGFSLFGSNTIRMSCEDPAFDEPKGVWDRVGIWIDR